MKATTLIKVVPTALIAGVMLTASAYAQDLDVTMDVVKNSDTKDITKSVMNKIELPKSATQRAGKHGRTDEMGSNNKMNNSDNMGYNYQMHDDANDTREDSHQMRNDANDTLEDSRQMRDDANDTLEDSRQMRDDANDTLEDSRQMRDDANDTLEDSHQMRGDRRN
jgi:hypothetical protein